jgi:hypothetical protein
MNELSEIDRALLESIKRRIEKRSGLPSETDLSQKDFDFLLFYIQDKTKQALSLTTLKRIWRKEYQRLPHLSTLDMLSQIGYGVDWHEAKKTFLEARPDSIQEPADISRRKKRKPLSVRSFFILLGVVTLFAGLSWYYMASHTAGDVNDIQFSAKVTTDLAVPNSVVFSYDVSGFRAKSFYIQQSWDPAKMVEISPANNKQTDIYYEPGYHYAKLLGNDKVLKEIPVHIKYKDWYIRFRYPSSELIRVDEADLHTTGRLGLKEDYLQRFKPLDTKFQMGFMLSKEFNVPADEFQFKAKVKFDSLYAPSCPMVNLLVKGDKDYAWITLGNKGCESNLGVKVSDLNISGKTNDLSALGMNAFSWQQIDVKFSNGAFILFVNNTVAIEKSYGGQLGELKEIDLFFNGIGSIAGVHIGDNNGDATLTMNNEQ